MVFESSGEVNKLGLSISEFNNISQLDLAIQSEQHELLEWGTLRVKSSNIMSDIGVQS